MIDSQGGAPVTAGLISDELLDEFDASVQMLGRLFSARHGEMSCETGLTTSQLLTLRVIGETGPARIGDVAAHVGVKAPAASAVIEALDKRGLIQREIDADDRRVTRVSLTPQGRDELVAGENERREHMRHYLSVLDEDDVRTMIRVQSKLIEAMVSERV